MLLGKVVETLGGGVPGEEVSHQVLEPSPVPVYSMLPDCGHHVN